MKTFEIKRTYQAPIETVWEVISDVGNYHHYTAPGIHDVKILSGEEEGMIRECSDPKGNSWTEVCTAWVPENHYSFKVNTDAADYKLPFRQLQGNWAVRALNEKETEVTMTFQYELKFKWIAWMFKGKFNRTATKDSEELMDNWETEINKRTAGSLSIKDQ